MATELGADAIKTDYTGDQASMKSVVEGCPIPILVLGGSRQGSDEEALQVVRSVALAGARGAVWAKCVPSGDMGKFLKQARTALDEAEPANRRR